MTEETLDLIYNVIGIIGVSLIIITYFLLQIEKMKSNSFHYSLINLVGAILITISLYRFWNLASFIIEVFWIAISIYGIAKAVNKKTPRT